MSGQTRTRTESLGAIGASIRAFVGVGPAVTAKGLVGSELLGTFGTLQKLVKVGLGMGCQLAGLTERFLANCTFVRLLAGVDAFVRDQRTGMCKGGIANIALVFAFVAVHSQVHQKRVPAEESLIADMARSFLVLGILVDAHVIPNGHMPHKDLVGTEHTFVCRLAV